MRGYLNDDAQTDRVMSGSWFFTGDTGYIDDQGRLVLVGRTRSEINKGGIKVAPENIDAVMERHPAISEACAFGVDDAILGQNVAIAVVLDLSAGTPPRAVELMRWCSSQLSDYMTPAIWYRISDLPRTSTGKIDRLEVARLSGSLERMR